MADFEYEGGESIDDLVKQLRNLAKRKEVIKKAVFKSINAAKKEAKRLAPVLTGKLKKNIDTKILSKAGEVQGILFVDLGIVPYARRQEFEHKSKAFFLYRGMLYGQQVLIQEIGTDRFLNNIVFLND